MHEFIHFKHEQDSSIKTNFLLLNLISEKLAFPFLDHLFLILWTNLLSDVALITTYDDRRTIDNWLNIVDVWDVPLDIILCNLIVAFVFHWKIIFEYFLEWKPVGDVWTEGECLGCSLAGWVQLKKYFNVFYKHFFIFFLIFWIFWIFLNFFKIFLLF